MNEKDLKKYKQDRLMEEAIATSELAMKPINKEQKTILAIQKAVPEILELKKGCRFVWLDEQYEEDVFEIINISEFEDILRNNNSFEIEAIRVNDIHKKIYNFDGYDEDIEQSFMDSVVKIIGRPITLEDVMIAIENPSISFRYFYKDKLHIQIEKAGRILGAFELNTPLQDQSEETKELLYNLIVKE